MPRINEYQQPSVGQRACSYSALGHTWSGAMVGGGQVAGVPSSSVYTVPKYCPSGTGTSNYPPNYDTLQHGLKGTCGGYFSLKNAFPEATCSSCQGVPNAPGYNPAGNHYEPVGQYVTRGCGSDVVQGCSAQQAPKRKEGFAQFFGL